MIPEIKKILYATDLGKNSLYASLYAVDMARKYDAKIVIVHSVEPFPNALYAYSAVVGPRYLREDQKQRQEAELEEIKKRVEEFPKRMDDYMGSSSSELISKVLVPLGHPVEKILEAADDEGSMRSCSGHTEKGF
jgi:nucleotide-binding universal stress UspA family protein